MKIVQDNNSMKAHSLILIDMGLEFQDALDQLKEAAKKHDIKLKKIVVCQVLGTKQGKIFYKTLEELKEYENIKKPYCIVIPSKLHFLEKEILEDF